jgi:hypothetical protein
MAVNIDELTAPSWMDHSFFQKILQTSENNKLITASIWSSTSEKLYQKLHIFQIRSGTKMFTDAKMSNSIVSGNIRMIDSLNS